MPSYVSALSALENTAHASDPEPDSNLERSDDSDADIEDVPVSPKQVEVVTEPAPQGMFCCWFVVNLLILVAPMRCVICWAQDLRLEIRAYDTMY